ncbi:MAG: transcriptional repressor [Rickettsiales bacterium]|jgi:Fe2+ or Zn2+ uptake regulation protein|nr:transcriptional repressor [Rickettsiales bacterium]
MKNDKNIDKQYLLNYAQCLSISKKQRWSKTRAVVYDVILDCEEPITAYRLIEKIKLTKKQTLNPMSVYRSLYALCELNLVIPIKNLNAFLPCRCPQGKHRHVLLICQKCKKCANIVSDNFINTVEATKLGFAIDEHSFEIYGICKECACV